MSGRLWKIVSSLFGILVVAFAFAYFKVIGFWPVTGTYRNSQYHYSLVIPPGWRLGTFLMLFLDGPKFGNTPTTDQSVVVTRSSRGDEWKSAELVNSDISSGQLPPYSDFLSGNVLVEVDQANLDPEVIRFPSSTSLQNIETVQTITGISGWKYDIVDVEDYADRVMVAYFPYSTGTIRSAQGVSFRVFDDGGLDDQIFEELYKSLSYGTSSANF
jgi:hypothetical protein